MSEETVRRSPQLVANELDISPATLRRWSDEFADYLSSGAGVTQGRSHRRYLDTDVETLLIIKDLMSDGMTYEQVRQTLNERATIAIEPDMIEETALELEEEDATGVPDFDNLDLGDIPPEDGETTTLVAANGADSPAIAFLTNTLTTLSDSQKSILNSQAANRELLGVLLQDNFNLKEENTRLRDRILDVERTISQQKQETSQQRQEEEWRREALRQELDAKINNATKLATEAITTAGSTEMPKITVENNPGCLGMFFGRGSKQVISTPTKKGVAPPQSRSASTGQIPQTSKPASLPSPNYPKPEFPPE